MLGSPRDINQIAEYADVSVRAPAPKTPRKGSLPGIKGRSGFNEWLYSKWGNRGNAAYTFIGSGLCVFLLGVLAWQFDEPILFPSLGASAFLFFETPMAEVSSARNTVIGHLVAGAVAFWWLFVFGFLNEPSALAPGQEFDGLRACACALSVAFTGGILRLLRAAHPPAGATTVIVSIGLLNSGHDMIILVIAVVVLTIFAGILNRLFGVPAPLWSHPYSSSRIKRTLGLESKGGDWWNQ